MDFALVEDAEIKPLVAASSVRVSSHVQVKLVIFDLKHLINVSSFKLTVKLKKGLIFLIKPIFEYSRSFLPMNPL